MLVRVPRTAPGQPLWMYVDEVEQPECMIVGGVAYYGDDVHERAKRAWKQLQFRKKSRRWTPSYFDTWANFLIEHNAHPLACYARVDEHLNERIQSRLARTPAAEKAVFGKASSGRKTRYWWLYSQLLARLAGGVPHLLRHYGKIESIGIFPDQSTIPEPRSAALRASFAKIDGERMRRQIATLMSTRPLDIPSVVGAARLAELCAWTAPTVVTDRSIPVVKNTADAHCSLCLSVVRKIPSFAPIIYRLRDHFPNTKHAILMDVTGDILATAEAEPAESIQKFLTLDEQLSQ